MNVMKRIGKRKRAVSGIVLCLWFVSLGFPRAIYSRAQQAQGKRPLVRDGSLENPLPAAIVALVVARDADGKLLSSESLYVPAQSSVALTKHQGLAGLERFEVIHLGVSRADVARNCEGSITVSRPTFEALKEDLKSLEYSQTEQGRRMMEIQQQLTGIQVEQGLDILTTQKNDPLRNELRRQAMENSLAANPSAINDVQLRQTMEDVSILVMSVLGAAMEWRAKDKAKQELLRAEKASLKPYAEQARLAVEIKRQDVKNSQAEIDFGAQFLAKTVDALAALAPTEAAESDFAVSAPPRRLCSAPSGLGEFVEVEAEAVTPLSVVFAETQFDKGETQKTFFRRVGRTNKWLGKIYWPVTASSAKFRVRIPGQEKWQDLPGSIQTNRPPLTVAVQNAEKSYTIIQKKLKEVTFRSVGADNVKTLATP